MSLITVTSLFGSGGEMIAQKVAEQLGIEFIDDTKLQARAISMGISSKDLEGLDEKAPRLFDRLFTTKPAIYLDLLGSVIYDIASTGEGVIVGHGAQVFLEDFHCALHVMIHASEETRSAWLSKEQNISEEDALQLIHRMDKRQKDFIQYAFKRDWKDSSGYDLVVNLEKVGVDWAEIIIVKLAGSNQIEQCSLKATEEMEASSLKRKVDAFIIKAQLSPVYAPIFVDITGRGKVNLRGFISSKEEMNRVIEMIKDVQGVSEVTSHLVVLPYAGYGE